MEIPPALDGDVSLAAEHGDQLGAFAISFLVIWALWSSHDRTMEYFRAYDGVVLRLTML